MKIKHPLTYLFCALLLFDFTSCKEDDPVVAPIDQLPPLTTTGENTFGCLVNGEAFVTKSKTKAVAIFQQNILQIIGNVDNNAEVVLELQIDAAKLENINYILDGTSTGKAHYVKIDPVPTCFFETNNVKIGTITITHFDNQNYIISGEFNFTAELNPSNSGIGCQNSISITNGRFDIKYIP